MRPIFDKLFLSFRKNSSQRRTPSITAPKATSTTGRGSKAYLRGDLADDGFRRSDEESGYSIVAVGNQDKARSSPVGKLDEGIVITTEWEVERR